MTSTETTTPDATSATKAAPGRTTIAPRVLDRVVSAVTGDALGVAPGSVGVALDDDAGSLSLTVSTPIRVASLIRIQNEPGVVDRQGGPLLDRAKKAQEEIRSRVQSITGSDVARVIVKITGVDIQHERRVK